MKQRLSDSTFWDIVHPDPAFRARFQGRVHPLQESNGGVDFHNPENLRAVLAKAQNDFETMPKVGMAAWARKNRVNVAHDWLAQVEWVYEHTLLEPTQLD